MSFAQVAHIRVDDRGIAGSRTKVIHIVMDKLAYDWSPEEIHAQHPHLSLADIHAAFTFYYDHQEELDAQIERDSNMAKAARNAPASSPAAETIRKLGQLL